MNSKNQCSDCYRTGADTRGHNSGRKLKSHDVQKNGIQYVYEQIERVKGPRLDPASVRYRRPDKPRSRLVMVKKNRRKRPSHDIWRKQMRVLGDCNRVVPIQELVVKDANERKASERRYDEHYCSVA
jgi:hypothetical protein